MGAAMIRLLVALILAGAPALAETPRPQALQSLLDYHAAACSAQNGTLTTPAEAVTEAYLFGPGDAALILDSSRLSCSTAPAMFCNEGIGCELNVFVGEDQHSLVVLNWSLENDDDRQLLVVTIAAELLQRTEDLTTRMTWDSAAKALTVVDEVAN